MSHTRWIIVSLLILMCFNNCRNYLSLATIPACIKQEIRKAKRSKNNLKIQVWQFKYKGDTVYFISASAADKMSVLLDCHCNIICRPDGGLTGKGDGHCKDFFLFRSDEKLIWQSD